MALSQSALNELLDAIRAGEGEDTLREATRLVHQELVESNVLSRIPKGSAERVLAAIRTIIAQPDAASARAQLD